MNLLHANRFSSHWKKIFQSLVKMMGFFQPLEKNFPGAGKNGRIFPAIGNFFSNHWKILPGALGAALLAAGCAGGGGVGLSVPEAARWTVSASSRQEGHPPALAADGDASTEWRAAADDEQPWWQADLGRMVPVCGFSVDWGAAPGIGYEVQLSSDGVRWSVACELEEGDGGWDVMLVEPVLARYVRLAVDRREQGGGTSLRDFEVFGIWTRPEVRADGRTCPQGTALLGAAAPDAGWRCSANEGELEIDLRRERLVGGLRVEWGEGGWAAVTEVDVSADDGETWKRLGWARSAGDSVTVMGQGLPARRVRLGFRGGTGPGGGFEVRHVELRGPEGTLSPWARLQEAADAAPELYPMVLRNRQPYWTAAGTNGAVLGEEGSFAGSPAQPALWPLVVADGRARTPATAGSPAEYALGGRGAGPLPYMRWDAGDGLSVRQRAMGLGDGAWELVELVNESDGPRRGWLCLALHPVAVAPAWAGGEGPEVRQVRFPDVADPHAPRPLAVNRATLYTVLAEDGPLAVGAAAFADDGDAIRYPAAGRWPPTNSVRSTAGLGSAVCGIPYSLVPGARSRILAWTGRAPDAAPDAAAASPFASFETAWEGACWEWADRTRGLDPRIDRMDAMDALRAQAGWLLFAPPPPASEPLGTVALRVAALLRAGHPDAARGLVRATAAAIAPDGTPPAALLADGRPDPAAEPPPPGEAEGQFAFMLMECHRFAPDIAFLTEHYGVLRRVLERLARLRDDEARANARSGGFFARTRRSLPLGASAGPHEGLLPPSADGLHRYAPLLWALDAWREGTAAAGLLGRDEDAAWMASGYAALRASLRTSMRAAADAMDAPGIPEAAERPVPSVRTAMLLAWPCDDPALSETWEMQSAFDAFYDAFLDRFDHPGHPATDAGEPLLALPLARLGRGDYAREILAMRLERRVPAGWQTWPDRVSPDPRRKGEVGPMPDARAAAAWIVGIRSLLADERGRRLDLLAGPPMEWLQYGEGVRVEHMPTAFGPLDLAAFWTEDRFRVEIGGEARPPAGYFVRWPLTDLPLRVTANGVPLTDFDATGCRLPHDFRGTIETTLPYLAPWPREP